MTAHHHKITSLNKIAGSFAFRCEMVLVALACVCGTARRIDAADPSDVRGEHNVVLRVTREHFDDLTRDEFRKTVPVERPLLSAWVSGTSVIEGRVKVEMEADDDEAVFTVILNGEAHTESISSVRSVRVHGGGDTTFRVEKRIIFNGIAYRGEPTKVTLENVPFTSHIESTRRGFLGRLAVRIAERRLPRMQPVALRILEEDARTMLRDEFDQLAGDLISRLNKTTPIEETIMKVFPHTEEWIYDLSTTDEYIQVSAGPRGFRFPDLPERARRDPVELWIRVKKGGVDAEVGLAWHTAQKVLRKFALRLATLPKPLRDEAAIRQVEDWVVIAVGRG